VLFKLTLPMLLVVAFAPAQRGGGSGAPPMTGRDPTPYEEFLEKLRPDDQQGVAIQNAFNEAGAAAVPVSAEMIRIRQQMVALGPDATPAQLAPLRAAYAVEAAKMVEIELGAYQKVHAVLKKGQQGKAAEALTIMAGLFHPLTPRPARGGRRGGGE
jgi:hypothetical protein